MRTTSISGADAGATIPIPAIRLLPSPSRVTAANKITEVTEVTEVTEIVDGQQVRIRGRLDVHTVADVRLVLHDVIDRGQGDIRVELGDVEVGDATGLGVLVGAHHRARRAGRRLVLLDVSPRLDRLLRAARLHRVLSQGVSAPATVIPAVF